MSGRRKEKDSLGEVFVDDQALWGAQTQRSIENFSAGEDPMPLELIYAICWIKRGCAQLHGDLGLLSQEKVEAILLACDEVLLGTHDAQFPLKVWQTGSGTQSHMNVNEVLANIASEKMGGKRGEKAPVHPNDDLNKGQSSNDVFPSAMHLSLSLQMERELLPALDNFLRGVRLKEKQFEEVIKTGRTHLMDAAPLRYGSVFAAFARQIELAKEQILLAQKQLRALAMGASAVGTGLNAHPELGERLCRYLNSWLSLDLHPDPCPFSALSSHEADLALSSALRTLATALFKMSNDLRFLASGPRCGLGEVLLPENEPGSSIMPGKVNPTQCEALCMICLEVMGCDLSCAIANSQGNFELNVFKPLILHNLLRAIKLLSSGMQQFLSKALKGLRIDEEVVGGYVERSLMLATGLNGRLGYDRVSALVRMAHQEKASLKEVVMREGDLSAEEFSRLVDPKHFV